MNTGLIALVAILVLVGGNQSAELGGGSRFPNGLSADSTAPSAGQVRGTTLTITGSATAGTSTVESLTTGGFVVSSSTPSATTVIAEKDVRGGTLLISADKAGGTSASFAASSTFTNLVPNAGDIHRVYFRNSTTTATAEGNITLTGGTGIILRGTSTASVIVPGGKGAGLIFWRSSTSTDIYVDLTAHW